MTAALSLALSLSSSFEKIGAIAAFAALVGIAALSLLVFAQARELKRLREWAGRAPERAAELEQRVTAEAAARLQRAATGAPPIGQRQVARTTPLNARPLTAGSQPAAPQLLGAQPATAQPAIARPAGAQPAAPTPATPSPAQVAAAAAGAAALTAGTAVTAPGAQSTGAAASQPAASSSSESGPTASNPQSGASTPGTSAGATPATSPPATAPAGAPGASPSVAPLIVGAPAAQTTAGAVSSAGSEPAPAARPARGAPPTARSALLRSHSAERSVAGPGGPCTHLRVRIGARVGCQVGCQAHSVRESRARHPGARNRRRSRCGHSARARAEAAGRDFLRGRVLVTRRRVGYRCHTGGCHAGVCETRTISACSGGPQDSLDRTSPRPGRLRHPSCPHGRGRHDRRRERSARSRIRSSGCGIVRLCASVFRAPRADFRAIARPAHSRWLAQVRDTRRGRPTISRSGERSDRRGRARWGGRGRARRQLAWWRIEQGRRDHLGLLRRGDACSPLAPSLLHHRLASKRILHARGQPRGNAGRSAQRHEHGRARTPAGGEPAAERILAGDSAGRHSAGRASDDGRAVHLRPSCRSRAGGPGARSEPGADDGRVHFASGRQLDRGRDRRSGQGRLHRRIVVVRRGRIVILIWQRRRIVRRRSPMTCLVTGRARRLSTAARPAR